MMFGLPLKLLTTFQNKASAVGKITWLCCSTWLCFNILFKQIFNLEHLKKLFSLSSRIKNSRDDIHSSHIGSATDPSTL